MDHEDYWRLQWEIAIAKDRDPNAAIHAAHMAQNNLLREVLNRD